MDRGTSSIQDLLSLLLFSIGPSVADIFISCVYIAGSLQPWIALIIFVTLVSYLPVTFYFSGEILLLAYKIVNIRKILLRLSQTRPSHSFGCIKLDL